MGYDLSLSLFGADLYTNVLLIARKLGIAMLAHLILVTSLHQFDKRIRDFDFSAWLESLEPAQRTQYFSQRILALGILYGLIIAFV